MPILNSLGARFKVYEGQYESKLDPDKYTIIRLDGYKFHKYTDRYFSKPFDIRMPISLILASLSLNKHFSNIAQFIYIQSDEVSLFIPNRSWFINEQEYQDIAYPFGLRVQKITSLFSSLLTTYFNYYLSLTTKNIKLLRYQRSFLKQYKFPKGEFKWIEPTTMANFDCRVFQVESLDLVKEYFAWRRIDAIRNSKNQFAYSFYSHKQTMNLSSNERIAMVKLEFGVDYYSLPEFIKVGVVYDETDDKRWFKEFGFNSMTFEDLKSRFPELFTND